MSNLISTAIGAMDATSLGIDVLGNNIANLNTVGYKSVNPEFSTLFSQTLQEAQAPTALAGGTGPMQIGAGVQLSGTSTNWSQGQMQATGNNLDLAIQGNGFFMLNGPGGPAYSRDGSLTLDATGMLTQQASGLAVQGLVADPATDTIPGSAVPANIVIPPGLSLNAKESTQATIAGNLNAATGVGNSTQMQYQYYDSLGVAQTMTIQFNQTAPDTWSYSGFIGNSANTVGGGTIVFNNAGAVSSITGNTMNVTTASTGVSTGAASPQPIVLTLSGLTQYSATSQVQATDQDGFAAGSLDSVNVDGGGNVKAVFSNGQSRLVAQLAVVNFANPSALSAQSKNVYKQTADTGSAEVVQPGTAGAGTIQSQALEESNVDLASQLTAMIVLQRSYQAAAKTVSTADQMLQDAIQLKQG